MVSFRNGRKCQLFPLTILENQKRLQLILNSSPIGWTINQMDGTILDISDQLCTLFGLPKADLLKMNAADVYYNPEDRLSFVDQLTNHGYTHLTQLAGNFDQ